MILIFGKTGQVASELKVFNGVHSVGRDEANFLDLPSCVRVILRYRPKAVINAVAYTSVDKAEEEPELAYKINSYAPGVIANTCAELKIPLVHLSTDYVFGGSGSTPSLVMDTPNPKNVYGISKFIGEKIIQASGCDYAILRTSWVFSVHGQNFVKSMLRLSETKTDVSVVQDQIGGPTYARDIAKTCMSIAKQLLADPEKSGTYHYSGAPDVSWFQFASTIYESAGLRTRVVPIETSEYKTRAARPLNSRLDCGTLKEIFGINRPSWKDGLNQMLNELDFKHG